MLRGALGSLCLIAALVFTATVGCSTSDGGPGDEGPSGPAGPEGVEGPDGDEPTAALETCLGCHGEGRARPVGNILSLQDAHYVDTDPQGPATPSGYRQLDVEIQIVDVTGTSVLIFFEVTDEAGNAVPDIFADDGRFTIARLEPGSIPEDSIDWSSLIDRVEDPGDVGDGPGTPETQATAERFDPAGFANLGLGLYRYLSAFDPTSIPIADGDTLRVAIQLSADDLPAGNGWCDFDADLSALNDCTSGTTLTRDIVQTATCNDCHGVTSDTKLAVHGGGRTDVEYCVTCHNPGSVDANSGNSVDMKIMIHKIHYGARLAKGYKIWGFRDTLHDYSNVNFTKDIDDCTTCHQGGGADVNNWSSVPTRDACGSCHDDVNFRTGANHGTGGVQLTDENCHWCHPPDGPVTELQKPIRTVHRGGRRATEGALYAGAGNGFAIEGVTQDGLDLTIRYSITRDGRRMSLENDPEWNAGVASQLAILVGWETSDYTNLDSGRTPAQTLRIDGLDVGGAVSALGSGIYEVVASLPPSASNTATVAIEGHPAADLDLPQNGSFTDRIGVPNVFQDVDLEGGASPEPRRVIVDTAKCNACHDSAGLGISLHDNESTGESQVCVLCHNADATDTNARPSSRSATSDGKLEEAIDFKRMIHQIHSGAELQDGIALWGTTESGSREEHDFSTVNFIGNRANCETCHNPDTYSTEDAYAARPSTIDTGADAADPSDDLNISQTAAVCSSCHDDDIATDHMKLNGASFRALDSDIF
jgi:OmcA/MtrC family decaheme c-type cytochrome